MRIFAIAALSLVLVQDGNLAWAQTSVPATQATATSSAAGPASGSGPDEFNDPLEGFNRKMFSFNLALDRAILRPSAKVYRGVMPKGGRRSVTNFLNNLDSPVILANDILQGELTRGLVTTARFGLNSTFGVAGFFDIARGEGLPRHDEDFGQTLGVWGVGSGPYLMIPLLGPSNPRDGVGMIVDQAFDPRTWVSNPKLLYADLGVYAVQIVSQREATMDQFDEIERNSIDFYAQVRSIYFQTRANDIKNGKSDYSDLPDISNLDGQ